MCSNEMIWINLSMLCMGTSEVLYSTSLGTMRKYVIQCYELKACAAQGFETVFDPKAMLLAKRRSVEIFCNILYGLNGRHTNRRGNNPEHDCNFDLFLKIMHRKNTPNHLNAKSSYVALESGTSPQEVSIRSA